MLLFSARFWLVFCSLNCGQAGNTFAGERERNECKNWMCRDCKARKNLDQKCENVIEWKNKRIELKQRCKFYWNRRMKYQNRIIDFYFCSTRLTSQRTRSIYSLEVLFQPFKRSTRSIYSKEVLFEPFKRSTRSTI
jgi:hypothetical protein